MTEQEANSGPGWYQALDGSWHQSSVPPAPGWWLADDGRWYQPAPAPSPAPLEIDANPNPSTAASPTLGKANSAISSGVGFVVLAFILGGIALCGAVVILGNAKKIEVSGAMNQVTATSDAIVEVRYTLTNRSDKSGRFSCSITLTNPVGSGFESVSGNIDANEVQRLFTDIVVTNNAAGYTESGRIDCND